MKWTNKVGGWHCGELGFPCPRSVLVLIGADPAMHWEMKNHPLTQRPEGRQSHSRRGLAAPAAGTWRELHSCVHATLCAATQGSSMDT